MSRPAPHARAPPPAPHPRTPPASPRSWKRGSRRLFTHLPRTRAPSFPSGLRRPLPQLHPRRGDLCVSGDFLPLPLLGLAGRPAFPRRPKRQQTRTRRGLKAPPAKEPERQTPTPHPTPGEMPGVRAGPQGRQAPASPCAAPPSLNFPTGPEPPTPLPSRSPRPPVSSTLRPHSARGRRGRRESPAPQPAANSPASAGAASREQGRRGRRRGKAAPPTPAATGCRSGSQPLADPRRLRRAGLRRRSRLPALAEESEPPGGAAGRSRVAKPPGQHGSRAAESRGRPTNPLGGAGVGARRAGRRRRPAEAAGPDTGSFSLGPPDGAEPTRRSPLRVRRFLTRRLRIDASACFPGESERERKKTFIETLQPAAAEKGDRLRELPPPALEPLAAGSATPAGGRGGGGA